MSETHATQACRRYANFIRDNPIASSRRTTPVQDQKKVKTIRPSALAGHQQETDRRQLFPHPPTQRFQPPEIPPMVTGQRRLRGSSQDVRRDPRFRQPPPDYSEIQQHRQRQPNPVEINEMGPTIQRGVIQCLLPKPQPAVGEPMARNVLHSREGQQSSSILPGQEQGRVSQAPRTQQDRLGMLPGNEVYLNRDDNVTDSV